MIVAETPMWGQSKDAVWKRTPERCRDLTQAERNSAIDMVDMGASQRQIARTFNCSQLTCWAVISRQARHKIVQDREDQGSQRQLKTATSEQYTGGTDSWRRRQRRRWHWDTPSHLYWIFLMELQNKVIRFRFACQFMVGLHWDTYRGKYSNGDEVGIYM